MNEFEQKLGINDLVSDQVAELNEKLQKMSGNQANWLKVSKSRQEEDSENRKKVDAVTEKIQDELKEQIENLENYIESINDEVQK